MNAADWRAACALAAFALLPRGATADATPIRAALLFDSEATRVRAGSADCVTRELRHADSAIEWIDEPRIRDAYFPWFEDASYTTEPEAITTVLKSRMGQQRATELGLRYIVFLTSASSATSSRGAIACGGAGQVGGCLGAAALTRTSSLTATVWDFSAGTQAADLAGHGTARDAVIAIGLPLWLPGGQSTKTLACKDLALSIHRVLHGDPDGRLAAVQPPPLDAAELGGAGTADGAATTDAQPAPAPLWPCLAALGAAATPAPRAAPTTASGPPAVAYADWVEWTADVPPAEGAAGAEFGVLTVGPDDLIFEVYGKASGRFRVPLESVSSFELPKADSPAVTVTSLGRCRAVFHVADLDPKVKSRRTTALANLIRERLPRSAAPLPH